MAGNYWTSTQYRNWHFSRDELAEQRTKIEGYERQLIQQYPLPDRRHLSLYFLQQIRVLLKQLPTRQQAVATAQVYLHRFYSQVEIRKTNPYLLIATALYLACKVEECPHHIRRIVATCRDSLPAELGKLDVARLGECEFYLISEMHSQMIVFHPYRTLTELQRNLTMNQEDMSLAWSVINDHYLTDLPLLYAPHVIAVAAIFLAMMLKSSSLGLTPASVSVADWTSSVQTTDDTSGASAAALAYRNERIQPFIRWLAQSQIHIFDAIDCAQEIISLYAALETYNESACKEQVARFIRARGLDKG